MLCCVGLSICFDVAGDVRVGMRQRKEGGEPRAVSACLSVWTLWWGPVMSKRRRPGVSWGAPGYDVSGTQ